MIADLESLYSAALALPPEQREALADRLLQSLAANDDGALEPEQEREIERRAAEVREGTGKLIPGDEAFASVMETVRSRKGP